MGEFYTMVHERADALKRRAEEYFSDAQQGVIEGLIMLIDGLAEEIDKVKEGLEEKSL